MAVALVALVAGGCGPEGALDAETGARVEITPGQLLLTEIGATATLEVAAWDGQGLPLPRSRVSWRVTDPAVAVLEVLEARAVAEGTTLLIAEVEGAADTAALEVYVDPNTGPLVPGVAYFGREGYIEYQPGSLPLIISAPHGGSLRPGEIPDRTEGTLGQDRFTEELTRLIADRVEARTGGRPFVVLSRLHRVHLDPNRAIGEAAQGNVFAEQAWREFHGFIEAASEAVEAGWQSGALYLDIHGHGHPIQRIELGYGLSASELALSDAELNTGGLAANSTVRTLAEEGPAGFAELIRGPSSLGGLLAGRGFRAVPSPDEPDPGAEPYFSGGYDVIVHGSSGGGRVSGIQVELNFDGVRGDAADRTAFADALALTLCEFLHLHFGYGPGTPPPAGGSASTSSSRSWRRRRRA